jgi:hypothetical protein
MSDAHKFAASVAAFIDRVLSVIPLPQPLAKLLHIMNSAGKRVHSVSVHLLAFLVAIGSAKAIVWLFGWPPKIFWRSFGDMTDNNPETLAWYGRVATFSAFLVAARLAHELYSTDETK